MITRGLEITLVIFFSDEIKYRHGSYNLFLIYKRVDNIYRVPKYGRGTQEIYGKQN